MMYRGGEKKKEKWGEKKEEGEKGFIGCEYFPLISNIWSGRDRKRKLKRKKKERTSDATSDDIILMMKKKKGRKCRLGRGMFHVII